MVAVWTVDSHWPPRVSRGRGMMTGLEQDIDEYVLWLGVHNYATTTIDNRRRYLGYLACFLGVEESAKPWT